MSIHRLSIAPLLPRLAVGTCAIIARAAALLAIAAVITGCATQPEHRQAHGQMCPKAQATCPACAICPGAEAPQPDAPPLTPATFADIPGWTTDAVEQAWDAFLTSCSTLINRPEWQSVC